MNARQSASKQLEKRRGGIDPAALAAATLSAAVSTLAQAGPYTVVSAIIGISLLMVVLCYDIDPHRTVAQSFAYSAVVGLIATIAAGYPLELWCGSVTPKRESAASEFALAGVWLVAAIACCIYDRYVKIKK